MARRDIYSRLWENAKTGKKGYYPVCKSIWKDGKRLKPIEVFAKYGRSPFEPLNQVVIEDVVMIQSLAANNKAKHLFRDYDFVIIDECHHVPAVTLEVIMKECVCKYILGLTATPKRKDGLERLLFQQCGPVRYMMGEQIGGIIAKNVYVRSTKLRLKSDSTVPLHAIWDGLSKDETRAQLIVSDIAQAIAEKRVSIVLSDRKEHLKNLQQQLQIKVNEGSCCLLMFFGGFSKKAKAELFDKLKNALDQNLPVCLFATASLLGEGFDLPELDTLFLAMPISYPGRLIQYAGRLHRSCESKSEVRIYDYLDEQLALTCSMYRKRLPAYRQMGYHVTEDQSDSLFH